MEEELRFAAEIAREAGGSTLRYFGTESLGLETKSDGTPVTRADREAEAILRRRIRETFPEDGILGEEEGESPGTSGRTWILDPIDGTKSFARGIPLYTTLVGLEVDGEAVVGAAHLPALGEMVYARRGGGAHWVTGIGGEEVMQRARVSSVGELSRALLSITSVGGFARRGRGALYDRLREGMGWDRAFPDAYGHLLVATGRVEAMVDPFVSVWDVAALQPIIEEAGGVFTDLSGEATHRGGSAVSTNAVLADSVRGLLR